MVLEFDHVGPKHGNLSDLVAHGYSLTRLAVEVAQCEVVCANCHRRRTFARRSLESYGHAKAAHPDRPVRQRNLELVASVLEDSRCTDCGEEDPAVLDFDHNGPKRRSVLSLAWADYSVQVIRAEIANCEVRCTNCHRRRTHAGSRSFRDQLFARTP